MNHAEKCPVCNGSGRVKNSDLYSTGSSELTCHGCKGLGWVEVSDTYPTPIPVHGPIYT